MKEKPVTTRSKERAITTGMIVARTGGAWLEDIRSSFDQTVRWRTRPPGLNRRAFEPLELSLRQGLTTAFF